MHDAQPLTPALSPRCEERERVLPAHRGSMLRRDASDRVTPLIPAN
jgi:hypothetical protein